MRVTVVLQRNNIGNMYKYAWLTQARKRIREDGTKASLATKGIHVTDAKDLLTPAYPREPLKDAIPPTLEETYGPPPPVKLDTPCYIFTHRFAPIAGLQQAQLLTNTLVRSALPSHITDHAAAADITTTPELEERVKEAILYAHLLDSYQKKLPRIIDVINRPGWVFPREYGIPLMRKHKTFTSQLLLLLDQVEGCGQERQLVEDASTSVMLHHSGRLMQMAHNAAYLISSPRPIPPVASPEEVLAASESEELPDLYPMSPFINCWPRHTYSTDERYGVASPHLYPHTIFVHHNQPRIPFKEDTFIGMTLLHAFSHAAAYAKLIKKNPAGDLAKPVTVQVVHMNCQHYHLGVFQLNTLNLSPSSSSSSSSSEKPLRNLFWTQGWEILFDTCKFKAGQPVFEGYNPKVFSLLRALHAQG